MIMSQNDAATEQHWGWAEQMTSYLVADIVPVIEEENEAASALVTQGCNLLSHSKICEKSGLLLNSDYK